jgi:UDP-galactose transporter B1
MRSTKPSRPVSFLMCAHSLVSLTSSHFYSDRYVIYPIQVLAKSCKPVPVMLMGAAMGKVYPARKYANVVMIVLGVALFMGAGTDKKKSHSSASDSDSGDSESNGSPSQIIGIVLLFVSLCFDGGTGAYEDKLMSVHSVQPFDLMYNIQLGKTILAFIGLLVLNQLHIFIQMVQEMGFLLVALGLSGALGQVFIFVTIAKFGALTCSIIGLARKVTTLVASIYFYGHHLNSLQFTGLMISVTAMVLNFLGKKGGGGGGHGAQPTTQNMPEEMQKMLDDEPHDDEDDDDDDDDSGGDVELAASPKELV